MKFKLDENLPAGAARVLADAGHDVSTALQERLGGTPDLGGSVLDFIGVYRRPSAAK
jgi:hypothetical protein